MGEPPVERPPSVQGAPAARRPIVTTSWDDGHPCDRRLADLLAECGVAGTFYIPVSYSSHALLDAQGIRALAQGFEIGGHSLSHPQLPRIEEARLLPEIAGCKQRLEEILGRPVATFCYPYGMHNRRVRQAVIEVAAEPAQRLLIANGKWRPARSVIDDKTHRIRADIDDRLTRSLKRSSAFVECLRRHWNRDSSGSARRTSPRSQGAML